MDDWTPNVAPDPSWWLGLDEQERISVAVQVHRGLRDGIHRRPMNEVMHGSLHAIVETQIATGEPEVVGRTVQRLVDAGVRRHVVAHGVMRELMERIAHLQERPFDKDDYTAALEALTPMDLIASGMRAAGLDDDPDGPPRNRAERRARSRGRSTGPRGKR